MDLLMLYIVTEFLAQAVYLSVDPYMRAYAPYMEIGKPQVGGQIARYVIIFFHQ